MLQDPTNDAPAPDAPAEPAGRRGPTPPRIDSRELLRGGREVVIVHGGEEYRLRHTSQGKLILTK